MQKPIDIVFKLSKLLCIIQSVGSSPSHAQNLTFRHHQYFRKQKFVEFPVKYQSTPSFSNQMAGIVLGGMAACRRTTHYLGLLRICFRPLGLNPALEPLHQRRCRHTSESENSGGKKPTPVPQSLDQSKGPAESGLEITAAPPNPSEVPGERRPESPYEVRPELPIEVQPNRSNPSPKEVKPPNPHTIICNSDKNETCGGKGVEPGDPVNITETKDFMPKLDSQASTAVEFMNNSSPPIQSINLSSTESKDNPKIDNLFTIESELKALEASISDFIDQPNHQTMSPITAEIKSMDSTSNGSETESGSTKSIDMPFQTSFVIPSGLKHQKLTPAEQKDKTISQITTSTKSQPSTEDECKKIGTTQHGLSAKSQTSTKIEDSSKLQVKNVYSKKGLDSKQREDSKPFHSSVSSLPEPQSKKASSQALAQSITSADKIEQSPELKTSESQTPKEGQNSSFNVPGECKGPGIEGSSETLIHSSAEFSRILDKAHEKRFETVKENAVDMEVIQKWVENFKLAEKKADSALVNKSSEGNSALCEGNKDKPAYIKESLVKENIKCVPKDTTSSDTVLSPSGQDFTTTKTTKTSTQTTLPLKIVAKHEAPTEFKKTFKPIPSSQLKSNKDTDFKASGETTKPIEFILSQPPATSNAESNPIKSSAMFVTEPNKIVSIAHEKTKNQSTDEIVAMFKDDSDGDQTSIEEGRVRELFETLDRFTDPSPSWTLPEFSTATRIERAHLDETDSENKTDNHFKKLGDLDSAIREEKETKMPNTEDKPNDNIFAKLSNMDSTIREESRDGSEKSEKEGEMNADQASFDLAQKISSFVKSAGESGTSTDATQNARRLNKIKSKAKSKNNTTSELTPGDLYDPISDEVSAVPPLEKGKTEIEENEDSNPGLEAPEVKHKKEEAQVKAPTATDETRTNVDKKAAVDENLSRKDKPQLKEGELSLKLLDKVTGEMPATTEMPGTTKAPAEKSLLQHIFDKILGRGKGNEGKRQMSSYTGRRHLSTSSMAAISLRSSPGESHSRSWDRTLVRRGSTNNLNAVFQGETPVIVGPQQSLIETPTFELFAKNKNDDTEIKGGSPECSSPKKTPRDLLREKQQTRKIKILGGSEECAKKMKRLEELTRKKDDDDCERGHFSNSLSKFFHQLWMRRTTQAK
ncbi:protein piccolo isoform X3 [Drosophila rhopaloa]|uniref:Protein piccolo n=1 Tax=Drosophila rhopaloa TaxID=1041015 RepID=A0ABM5GWT4_DRORH|nr:protein piccolo isoform X3 [Drosophila rhopaloa]